MIPVFLLKTLTTSAFSFFSKKSRNEMYQDLFIVLARELAKLTSNTVDDKIVEALVKCVRNEDSGLQRKPTGPRKKGR
jgi:hypothetical protein